MDKVVETIVESAHGTLNAKNKDLYTITCCKQHTFNVSAGDLYFRGKWCPRCKDTTILVFERAVAIVSNFLINGIIEEVNNNVVCLPQYRIMADSIVSKPDKKVQSIIIPINTFSSGFDYFRNALFKRLSEYGLVKSNPDTYDTVLINAIWNIYSVDSPDIVVKTKAVELSPLDQRMNELLVTRRESTEVVAHLDRILQNLNCAALSPSDVAAAHKTLTNMLRIVTEHINANKMTEVPIKVHGAPDLKLNFDSIMSARVIFPEEQVVEPTPAEPTPVEPTHAEPTPVEPTHVEPTPVEPVVVIEPATARDNLDDLELLLSGL